MRRLASNQFIVFLLCLTVLFRAVIPVGMMPDLDALRQGDFKLTICSGASSKEIWVDKNLNPVKQQHGIPQPSKSVGTQTLCPFAAWQIVAMPLLAAALLLILTWRRSRSVQVAILLSVATLSLAWPRAPPAFR